MNHKKIAPGKIVLAVIFFLYLLFNLILLILHEPWRDEANVWLMAKELSPLQLLREIKYQGHPCLWYFFVMPFAKAGFPFRTIEVLSYLVMGVTAGIFCFKAPLGGVTKAFCLFSPIFTYFYPDIARNYCLVALILVLLAWQFPQRNNHVVRYGILLGLLVQADTIAIPAAGLISAMWFFEGLQCCIRTKSFHLMKRIFKGIWIPAFSLFLWVLQFYQVSDSPQFQIRELGIRETIREVRNFAVGILIRLTGMEQIYCKLLLGGCLIVLLIISINLRNGWPLGVMAGTFLFQAAFSAVIYQLHIWHYISLGFVLIWTIWVSYQQAEEKGNCRKWLRGSLKGLEILFIVLAICMFWHWNSDEEPSNLKSALNGVYSDAGDTASFVKGNIASDELIVSDNVPMASTILAYLENYKFYYAGNGKIESYADWSEEQSREITCQELFAWISEVFPEREYFFMIQSTLPCIYDTEELEDCEVIYRSAGGTVREEEYTIYKVFIQ